MSFSRVDASAARHGRVRWTLFFAGVLAIHALLPRTVDARQANVRVVYQVEEVRSGRFTANVFMTNVTPAPIASWSLAFEFPSPIDQMDNVTWTQTGGLFRVEGAGWTHRIEPGEVAWFTIHGVASGPLAPRPASCAFNGAACTIENADEPDVAETDLSQLRIAAWIAEEDQTTYTGHVFIRNPTEVDLEPWRMTFSTSSLITGMDGVNWTRSGSSYEVRGTGATNAIRGQDFVFFTFSGVHSGTAQLPTSCQINGVACTFVEPDELIETPRMNLFFKVEKITGSIFEGFIELINPSAQDLSSWTLRFNLEDRITFVGGDVSWSRAGDLYTLHGINGKRRVRGEGSVFFPIAGTFEDDIEPPSDCTVNGVVCLIEAEGTTVQPDETDPGTGGGDTGGGDTGGGGGGDTGGGDTGGGDTGGGDTGGGDTGGACTDGVEPTNQLPDIDFRFLSVTSSQYVALVRITNNTSGFIRGWSLQFSLIENMTVGRHWESVFTQNPDGSYLVTNIESNACIPAGENITFGFDGSHDGTFAEPLGCAFDSRSCTFLRMVQVSNESDRTNELPSGLELGSPYPNPFHSETRLDLALGATSHVRATLWDVSGRLVRVLHDGILAAGNGHALRVDAGSLSPGLYLVRIEDGRGHAETRKILLGR